MWLKNKNCRAVLCSAAFLLVWCAGAAFAALSARAAETTLPTVFDATTGYVTLEQSDVAHGKQTIYAFCTNNVNQSIPSVATGKTGSWSESALAPHSGTNYYVGAKKTLCTDNSVGKAYSFAGDRLVIDGDGRLQSMATGKNVVTINDLWMKGFSSFHWTGAKNPLYGTAHIVDSAASRCVYFRLAYSGGAIQKFAMKVIGDATQALIFTGDTSNTSASLIDGMVRTGNFQFLGDMTEYQGLIYMMDRILLQFKTSMPGTIEPYGHTATNLYIGTSDGAGAVTLGTVETYKGAKIVAATNSTLTINSLTLHEEASLGINCGSSSDTPGKIVINGGSLPDIIRVQLSPSPNKAGTHEILRIAKSAVSGRTLTTNDFDIAIAGEMLFGTEFAVADKDGCFRLEVTVPEVVTHNTGCKSSSIVASNDLFSCYDASSPRKYFWSNNLCPMQDPKAAEKDWDFASASWYAPGKTNDAPDIYEIPARAVYLSGGTLSHFSTSSGLRGNFIWNGFIDNGNADGAIKFIDPETGAAKDTFGYYGSVYLCSDSDNSLTMYSNEAEIHAAEYSGGGNLILKTFKNASSPNNNQGWHEILGTNVNWTGKVKVTQEYETNKYAASGIVTPNMNLNCRLVIRDARNLGGARETFAYDAFEIEHYARLLIREDVTLAGDLNRGVSVGDIGRFWQGEGKTLTINQPITLHGQLYKEGKGTLVLGGTAMKFGGSKQSETPTAGSNLVTIAEGALMVTNAAAADGAAITFKSGTTLLVNAGATAATALRSVKNGSSIASEATDGKIPVTIDMPDNPPRGICETVLCTATQGTLDFDVAPTRGYVTSAVAKTTAEDVTTYTVTLTPRGMMLMFR